MSKASWQAAGRPRLGPGTSRKANVRPTRIYVQYMKIYTVSVYIYMRREDAILPVSVLDPKLKITDPNPLNQNQEIPIWVRILFWIQILHEIVHDEKILDILLFKDKKGLQTPSLNTL